MKPPANPWVKFYPADWRADAELRLCSIGARGLWAEMMCLMHAASENYGSLLVNGRRIDKKQLANLAGISEKECSILLLELETNGVFSRDESGTIYSRRMRRDHAKALKDKENGKLGGNPKVIEGVNPPVKGEVKAQKPEARDQKLEKKEERPDALLSFDLFWDEWPNRVGKSAALRAFQSAIKRAALPEILDGVRRYVREKPPDRPWLNPATFLNQSRWEDRPAAVGAKNGQSGQISSACDNLIKLVSAGFPGAPPEDDFGGGEDEADARLIPFRRG